MQQDLSGACQLIDDQFGDSMVCKQQHTLRTAFVNVRGVGVYAAHEKTPAIRGYMEDWDVDQMLIAEGNANWSLIKEEDSLYERFRGRWEGLNVNTAHLLKPTSPTRFQYGGVASILRNKASHKVFKSGRDKSGMGRWCWTLMQGKGGIRTRFITGYRPCKGGTPGSVYNQQAKFMVDRKDYRCPRDAFFEDLEKEMRPWMEAGEQLVFSFDCNSDTRSPTIISLFASLHMREIFVERHGRNAPPTHNTGTKPIDAVFASTTIEVVQCAMTPFDMFLKLDHRILVYDITYTSAFGTIMPDIRRPKARRCQCNQPRVVQRFAKRYEKEAKAKKLPERAFQLERQARLPLTPRREAQFEWIHHKMWECIIIADKNCRKKPMGAVDWTPLITKAQKVIGLWLMVLKRHSRVKVSFKHLTRFADQLDLQDAPRTPPDEAKKKLDEAYRHWKELKKGARKSRQNWLDQVAEDRALNGDTTKATELKQMKLREAQRESAQRIRRTLGRSNNGSTSMVIAPDEFGTLVEMVEKDDLERACLKETEQRFTQAHDTPCLQEPLLSELGYLGDGPAAEAILNGNYIPPPGTDYYAKKLFPFLKQPDAIRHAPPILQRISTEQYKNGWKKAREHTACGPSGIHFGYYIAGLQSEVVAQLEASMATFALISGYSPKRWRQAANAILIKVQGDFRIAKQRIITIMESDFNQNNKFIGREMMYHAEQHNVLSDDQMGSRKDRTSDETSVCKVLTFDLIRQKRIPAIISSNDLKSCYDRIAHSFANLSMRRVGVPVEPILCMFKTIQEMEHYVRTVYGQSSISTGGHLWLVPPHGVGQGNGAGPSIWAVVSTPVLDLMKAEGFGIFFRMAITKEEIRFVAFTFVDDADTGETARDLDETFSDVNRRMQANMDMWQGTIRVTGGAVVPDKTFWYGIDFVWTDGIWKYATTQEAPGVLRVRDSQGVLQTLERVPVDEARRTLGVWSAPDGNWDLQTKLMVEKAETWTQRVSTGHLNKYDAWTALTYLFQSLRYPLAATCLSRTQVGKIMKPILDRGLPAIGVCRKFSRKVLYGTLRNQGIALPDLYLDQYISHIHLMLQHGRATTNLGKQLRASLQQLKLEIGLPGSVLSHDFSAYGCLATISWISRTWQFLSENGMQMWDDTPDLPLRRVGDKYLVLAFYTHGYRGGRLLTLNRCRQFLKATTLADIVDGDGRNVSRAAWEGVSNDHHDTPYEWPYQGRPSNADWKEWQLALTTCFHLVGGNHSLGVPLGKWTDSRDQWSWFYAPSEERLYYHPTGNDTWFYCPRLPGRPSTSSRSHFGEPRGFLGTPPSLLRTKVYRHGASYYCTGTAAEQHEDNPPPPKSLSEILDELPASAKWAVQQVAFDDAGEAVAAAMRAGTVQAVADGSFKDSYGTSAWKIRGESQEHCITGVNISPGDPKLQCSHRSELAGFFGITIVAEAVCKAHNIDKGSITFGSDGLNAIRRTFDLRRKYPSKIPHFDLVGAIQTKLHESLLEWSPHFIRSHQDDHREYDELDQWEQDNVDMDDNAKTHWAETQDSRPRDTDLIDGEPWPLWLLEEKLSTRVDDAIYEHVHGRALQDWWVNKKERYTVEAMSHIDFDAIENAMKNSTLSRRRKISKHISGMCGVNKLMKAWGKRESDECPRCGQPEESSAHVWQCRDPRAIRVWTESVDKLRQWMVGAQTHPDITSFVCSRLMTWKTDVPPADHESLFPGITTAMEIQDDIGWRATLEGSWAQEWADVQRRYYLWIDSQKSSRRWISQLIRKVWEVAWDQWEHRNGLQHEPERLAQIEDPNLNDDIRAEYRLGPVGLLPRDHYHFQTPLAEMLRANLVTRQRWLANVSAARERRDALGRASRRRQRQALRNWLSAGTD